MEIRQLRYFLAVAEELSFTRAAERLNMAQPPLSRQLKALEEEIGAPFFDRTQKGLALTRAGLAMRDEATHILARLNSLRRVVRENSAIERPSLSVGFVSAAAYGLLPRIVRQFREGMPETELHLRCLTNREQVSALETGEISVGLAWLPFDLASAQSLPLQKDRFCVALPSDHPLTRHGKLTPALLRGHAVIYGCRTPSIGTRIMRLLEQAGSIHKVDDLDTAIDSVAAGLGVAIVPDCMRPARTGHVVYRDIECEDELTLGLVTLVPKPTGVLAAFMDSAHSAEIRPSA